MTPEIFNLGPMELVIILVIVLLLFGGSRLAGLGKSTGRALKEFKEETKGLTDKQIADASGPNPPAVGPEAGASTYQQPPTGNLQPPVQAPGVDSSADRKDA